ncbi:MULTISPECIES: mechanosensitive ion channel family protein [Cyanophyceae]|uniref:mechanosensitive ion channel family protein n=1 Tax=Cyanophyceae TaxID=3028117 RepID=UPI00168A258E|nr:mechanosensitive ion channel domain-containing protein [Trichocoleus sp. FACHB-69]MBD1933290.1 mechanosensitive ion channel [Trichocoleus sp. FACHB-69]
MHLISPQVAAYQKVVKPYEGLLVGVIGLATLDTTIHLIPGFPQSNLIELPISLSLAIAASWLASRLFKQIFDIYLLDAAINSGHKVNSEILLLVKLLANLSIIFFTIIIFSETHKINIFGLVASLGIGGLAVAFAAQKTLEQILGGIVIYLDRPFVVDDYIGLPDGIFGRVESIGLRSTKIRTSGKGTLIIVPNSSLTQVNIENFTGAKKVMALVYLNFHRTIEKEEQALIRQVILNSTSDIFGIDSRNTDVNFRELNSANDVKTQAQIAFFILGSSDVSMGLRRQLFDIATENITEKLKYYDIAFDIEDPTIYVDSPITI